MLLSSAQLFNAEHLARNAADKVFGMTQLSIKPSLPASQTNSLKFRGFTLQIRNETIDCLDN